MSTCPPCKVLNLEIHDLALDYKFIDNRQVYFTLRDICRFA